MEPICVRKRKQIKIYDIAVPKIMYGIKIPINQYKNIEIRSLIFYVNIIFDVLFDKTSLFYEKELEKDCLEKPLKINVDIVDNYILVLIYFTSKK